MKNVGKLGGKAREKCQAGLGRTLNSQIKVFRLLWRAIRNCLEFLEKGGCLHRVAVGILSWCFLQIEMLMAETP